MQSFNILTGLNYGNDFIKESSRVLKLPVLNDLVQFSQALRGASCVPYNNQLIKIEVKVKSGNTVRHAIGCVKPRGRN